MNNNFLSKVFMNMFIGLLVTFLTSYIVSTNYNLMYLLYGNGTYWIIVIAEILVAVFLSARIHKMKGITAAILYFLYAVLTGLSFSGIFIVYSLESIIWIFLATSIVFGIFAFIGKTTKIDLSKVGTFLIMGLVCIIILEIVNIFLLSSSLNLVLCVFGIIVFMGFIAYDIQKILLLARNQFIPEENLAIIGAFELYLDFINIFIRLLQLFGKGRD